MEHEHVLAGMHVPADTNVPRLMCGGQRATLRNQLFLATSWDWGMEPRSAGLHAGIFTADPFHWPDQVILTRSVSPVLLGVRREYIDNSRHSEGWTTGTHNSWESAHTWSHMRTIWGRCHWHWYSLSHDLPILCKYIPSVHVPPKDTWRCS